MPLVGVLAQVFQLSFEAEPIHLAVRRTGSEIPQGQMEGQGRPQGYGKGNGVFPSHLRRLEEGYRIDVVVPSRASDYLTEYPSAGPFFDRSRMQGSVCHAEEESVRRINSGSGGFQFIPGVIQVMSVDIYDNGGINKAVTINLEAILTSPVTIGVFPVLPGGMKFIPGTFPDIIRAISDSSMDVFIKKGAVTRELQKILTRSTTPMEISAIPGAFQGIPGNIPAILDIIPTISRSRGATTMDTDLIRNIAVGNKDVVNILGAFPAALRIIQAIMKFSSVTSRRSGVLTMGMALKWCSSIASGAFSISLKNSRVISGISPDAFPGIIPTTYDGDGAMLSFEETITENTDVTSDISVNDGLLSVIPRTCQVFPEVLQKASDDIPDILDYGTTIIRNYMGCGRIPTRRRRQDRRRSSR